ncbi:hypothetical protein SAMN02745166_04159 [Prosthecobacter debontii]|uniref:HMA domain-containing protein n=1 Tax=Prosthecobacter debontii TaxID=48467 RepID=A0A1T4YT52_9BACT|nr:hypothetical protein [Prosthecobacter debontii]SKB04932.1 hypothetical protein SAMN02745166_04159 [Prosthecobacter debontii]
MIEIEVYAPGLRAESNLLELRGQMDLFQQVNYKVDANHDLVYFEVKDPQTITMQQIMECFTNIGLAPRLVGQAPEGWN